MTEDEKLQESSLSDIVVPVKEHKASSDTTITEAFNSENCSITTRQSTTSLNFSTGVSSLLAVNYII